MSSPESAPRTQTRNEFSMKARHRSKLPSGMALRRIPISSMV